MIIGAISGGLGLSVKAAIVMVVVQQVDNHFISPNVMGRAVRLHPVTIILALLAGGTLAGLFGMPLSVPATAVGKIFLMHYYNKHILGRDPWEDDEDELLPPAARKQAWYRRILARRKLAVESDESLTKPLV